MTFAPEIEPLMPSEAAIARSELPDLVLDLERKAAALAGEVSPITARVLESHMRVINSYYSNLIEGNRTQPHEIRQAMAGDYSQDPVKRDLQRESVAHIQVQEILGNGESLGDLVSPDAFRQIHQLFFERVPASMRVVKSGDGSDGREVEPGSFRKPGENVNVGRHLAPASEELDRLFKRFQEVYNPDHFKGLQGVMAAMAAHHRFVWIHPFLDGNGRVARLHTDLFLRRLNVGASGIWCLSRGLARQNEQYKAALARADFPRQGASDGRGSLSEQGLVAFCEFMLKTAIDQVEYMKSVLDLGGMSRRMKAYVEDRNKGLVMGMPKLRPEALRLIEKAYTLGEFPRSQKEEISGLSESVTRKLLQQLKEEGLLTETSNRSPLRWAIPEHAERYYLPELAPVG